MKEIDEKLKMLELEKSFQLRNFEIELFWKRSWFFGALIIFLLTVYFSLLKNNLNFYLIFISFLTFLISLFQSLMNRGSKYWQERWEYKVKNRESALNVDITLTRKFNNQEYKYINACILSKGENFLTRANRFSVSKITFLVWDIITISCLLLWFNDINKIFQLFSVTLVDKIVFYHFTVIFYIMIFLIKSKWKENLKVMDEMKSVKEMTEKYIENKL